MFKLQIGSASYRIIGPGGEEGDTVDFGDLATLECGGRLYAAFIDPDEEKDDMDSISKQTEPLEAVVYELTPVGDTELEEVQFSDEDEEDDDPDDGDGGDDGPDEVVLPDDLETDDGVQPRVVHSLNSN